LPNFLLKINILSNKTIINLNYHSKKCYAHKKKMPQGPYCKDPNDDMLSCATCAKNVINKVLKQFSHVLHHIYVSHYVCKIFCTTPSKATLHANHQFKSPLPSNPHKELWGPIFILHLFPCHCYHNKYPSTISTSHI
jgi:hypothetical protein